MEIFEENPVAKRIRAVAAPRSERRRERERERQRKKET